MQHSTSADINYTAELTESVEELRDRLEAMKRLMAEQGRGGGGSGGSLDSASSSSGKSSDSIIDGSFLSVVFAVVLTMILSVSIYAFQNLYYAILKKFPSKHTEL
ncbi:hypothetical protein J437_LFUL004529 [Ladona fulva]|uniref:Uncharacterized protein n=1 Tax=Ladona fulva TaxID=123851 RepID=A0A8K0P2H1_LADFU|nr:hypothetical protein J437_LFUL004529 [Ladona fulva]